VRPGVAFDFLVDIAAELPMQMICILLGCLKERHWLFPAIEPTFDFGESRKGEVGTQSFEEAESVEEAGSRMFAYGTEADRREKGAAR
jgi:cytochrome P450